MRYKKIRITGSSGSGKTYLGQLLSHKTGIPFYSMDAIAYDLSSTYKFDDKNKRSLEEREKILKKLIREKQWILDGSYYSTTKYTYDQADIIIVLLPGFFRRLANTLKRFFRRAREGKYEGFLNYLDLTWYNIKSRDKWNKRIAVVKKEYASKVHAFRTADDAYAWLTKD